MKSSRRGLVTLVCAALLVAGAAFAAQAGSGANEQAAKGGSMGAAGPVIAGRMLFVPSGYVGVRNGIPGNVLLAFGL